MASLRGLLAGLLLAFLLVPAPAGAGETTPREQQWGLERVRAPEAWQETRGQGVVVAVVDTGVDYTHPDLAPRLLRNGDGRVIGRNEVDGNGDAQDGHGHGTHVAGIVAAAADAGVAGKGIAGVAPQARIMPVKVLDDRGRGSMSALDAGIRWAVDNGADVINLSLESAVPLPGELVASGPDAAVSYAWERGVAVVAAAGNDGTPFTDYRSSTPVLLVGASDRDDRRALSSDAGRSDMVFAPGVGIISSTCARPRERCGDDPRHGYGTKSGTSFAAPHAAGALALLMSQGAGHERAVERLRSTATPLRGGGMGVSTGHGLIDAAAALGLDESSTQQGNPKVDEETDGTADSTEPATGGEPSTGDADAQQRSRESTDDAPDEGRATSSAPERDPKRDPKPDPGADHAEAPSPEADPDREEVEDDGVDRDEDPAETTDPEDAAREATGAVELPQRSGRDGARVGLLEGFAGALVLGSAAALVGVRRRFGAF